MKEITYILKIYIFSVLTYVPYQIAVIRLANFDIIVSSTLTNDVIPTSFCWFYQVGTVTFRMKCF